MEMMIEGLEDDDSSLMSFFNYESFRWQKKMSVEKQAENLDHLGNDMIIALFND